MPTFCRPSFTKPSLTKFAVSGAARFHAMLLPETRAKKELRILVEKRIRGSPEEKAEALTEYIIAEGAAFCKLAQVSAEQPNVVDPVTRDALRKVQTSCEAATPEYIEHVLQECIDTHQFGTYDLNLADFETTPLGVGSVAQVHGCGDVVVKIALTENLKIMKRQVDYIPKLAKSRALKKSPLKDVSKFLEGAMGGWEREFDMKETEGVGLQTFTKFLKNNPGEVQNLRLPEFKAACSRVIVMSRESGRPFKALTRHDQKKCLSTVLELASKSLFGIRMVHCDPHPGNILLNDKQEVVLLDWGTVLVFSEDQVQSLKTIFCKLPDYLASKATGADVKAIANAMRKLGFTTTKDSDEGLAMLAWHAFDSRLPAPLEMMKNGKYGCKDDPPEESFPPLMTPFLRFRSVLGGIIMGISHGYANDGLDGKHILEEINLIDQFSKIARGKAVADSSTQSSQKPCFQFMCKPPVFV